MIAAADGIENRLAKLLAYLAAHDPDRHWDQFLDSSRQPAWEKIAVAGSSQGGGHAYVLGKIHTLARVIMFASPKDYSGPYDSPPRGFDADTRTPLDRFFAFNHMRDDGHGCTHAQQANTLEQMKLTGFGVANVEQDAPPYRHARVLYTDADVPGDKFHGSVSKFGEYASVWRYLLTEPVQ
jgi:hypothetical protein